MYGRHVVSETCVNCHDGNRALSYSQQSPQHLEQGTLTYFLNRQVFYLSNLLFLPVTLSVWTGLALPLGLVNFCHPPRLRVSPELLPLRHVSSRFPQHCVLPHLSPNLPRPVWSLGHSPSPHSSTLRPGDSGRQGLTCSALCHQCQRHNAHLVPEKLVG